jgi:hypothetical protein
VRRVKADDPYHNSPFRENHCPEWEQVPPSEVAALKAAQAGTQGTGTVSADAPPSPDPGNAKNRSETELAKAASDALRWCNAWRYRVGELNRRDVLLVKEWASEFVEELRDFARRLEDELLQPNAIRDQMLFSGVAEAIAKHVELVRDRAEAILSGTGKSTGATRAKVAWPAEQAFPKTQPIWRTDIPAEWLGKWVTEYQKWGEQALIALNEYAGDGPVFGLESALRELDRAAFHLEYPTPIEVEDFQYSPSEFTGSFTIRFADGSERVGEEAQCRGVDLVAKARRDSIVALKQWLALVARDWSEHRNALAAGGEGQNLVARPEAAPPAATTPPAKGRAGRRGYPLKALEYAKSLRQKHPRMKAHAIRQKCLKRFSEDDLPPDTDSFRRWLNRKRANRAN